MTKSFYIILTAVAATAVSFLIGQWAGRSLALTKGLLARQIHESFCHATEQYDTNKTNLFPALFREELNKQELHKLMFRIDTVSLNDPKTVQRNDIRYFADYERLFNERHTFVYPINDTQGIYAYINPRAGYIGRLLYYFFGTVIALIILAICIRKQINIIKRQDEIARIREDFSYAMIHDMKTPLSSILMGARILRSGKLDKMPEKKEKFFDILEEEAEHLITFELNIEKENIFADEEYLKEAVSNLIDNAIKYSKETVDIQITSCMYNKFIQIKVKDNGIGISLSAQNHIFDKFERASASRNAVNGVTGFGLGLNYVMNVTRSHGGYVSVESQEGKYSEFTISLPLPTEYEITV